MASARLACRAAGAGPHTLQPSNMATEADASAWDAVRRRPASDATGYHSWAWQRVFKNAFGHDSIYLVARDDGSHRRCPAAGAHQERAVRALADVDGVPELRRRRGRLERAWRSTCWSRPRDVARRVGCRHVELRHKARRFPELALPAAQGDDAAGARSRHVGAARSQGEEPGPEGAEVRPDGRARRRSTAPGVLSGVCTEHARPGHAGLLAAAVRRGACASSRIAPTFTSSGWARSRWLRGSRFARAEPSKCPGRHRCATSTACARTTCCIGASSKRRSSVVATRWTSAGRRHTRAPTSSRSSGAPTPVPLHWEYVLTEGATMPEIAAGNPKFRLLVEAWTRLPLSLATALGPTDRPGHPVSAGTS